MGQVADNLVNPSQAFPHLIPHHPQEIPAQLLPLILLLVCEDLF